MPLEKTPVFFISHGGPTLLYNHDKPGEFYDWLGQYLTTVLKPKAILIMSAHWQSPSDNHVLVDISESPSLIYDFAGFPSKYYNVVWDHQGSAALAKEVIDLLGKAGIRALGKEYGHDHGVWVPLKKAIPSNMDIPVIEMSTFAHEDLALHYKLGQALAPLRDRGVVIIGSGSAVHNLYDFQKYMALPTPPYVKDFDKHMETCAVALKGEERRTAAVALNEHTFFRDCHPTAEHLVPFHFALGAAGSDDGIKLLEDYTARLSWGSYVFGLDKDVTLPAYKSEI